MQKPLTKVEEAPSLKFDTLFGHMNHLSPLQTKSHSFAVSILTTLVNLNNDRLVMVENS